MGINGSMDRHPVRLFIPLTLALFCATAAFGETKRDIQGVALGMTVKEVEQIVSLSCFAAPNTHEMRCGGEVGEDRPGWTLSMTEMLEPKIVHAVEFHFCTDESDDAVRKKVESAFTPVLFRDLRSPSILYSARLDEKTRLIFERNVSGVCARGGRPYRIKISDQDLYQRDRTLVEQERAKATAKAPVPRF